MMMTGMPGALITPSSIRKACALPRMPRTDASDSIWRRHVLLVSGELDAEIVHSAMERPDTLLCPLNVEDELTLAIAYLVC